MPEFLRSSSKPDCRFMVWNIEENAAFFEQTLLAVPAVSHPKKLLQHLAGRYCLQALEPNFPLADIQIAATNKPFLPNNEYYFSISHCKNFAAAIISTTQAVGIDVEVVTPKVALIQHKFCNASETRWLNSLAPSKKLLALTLIWSAKEALFKWWGNGGVDFSEHLHTQPFEILPEGEIHAAFLHPLYQTNLLLRYYTWDETVLVVTSSYLPNRDK